MRDSRARRFNLLDMMILTVAVALTAMMVANSVFLKDLLAVVAKMPKAFVEGYASLRLFASPFLAPLTLAVLVMRLREPRPRLRRLCRQPGFVALSSAAMMIVANLLTVIIFHLKRDPERLLVKDSVIGLFSFLESTQPSVGSAVAGAWFIQAISSHWRSEATWIDRIGRILGVLWVAIDAFALLRFFLQ